MKTMQKARARVLLRHPFYGTIVMGLPMRENRAIPTACTDMKTVEYNPDFVAALPVPQVETLIAHEGLHVVYKHGLRRGSRDPYMWNVACDYAINLMLVADGFAPIDNWLCDQKYSGMGAEQIYDAIMEKERDRMKSQRGRGEDPGKLGDGFPNPQDGDFKEPENMSPDEKAEIERKVRQQIAQAAAMARMAGKMSAGMERLVKDILDPAVPWQALLRDYMTRITHDNESWSRRNRRFANIYLPARWNQRMGEVVIIGDTSGSISNDELKRVGSEAAAIADAVQPERIRFIWADTEVAGEQCFEAGEIITPEPKGGGGTDMRVPLVHAEQYEPQVVVLVTDGHTPWPEVEPPYPLIVVCTTNAPVPVGMVVRI
jgi:predicted metal-dependent peptidase